MPRRLRSLPAVFVGILLLSGLMAGCSATVSLPPAPAANDPLCAEVSVRLPDRITDNDRLWTDAQATGAWGDPVAVLLSCGVEPPGPSTLPCQTVDGVDWIIDDEGDNRYRVTTFGRTPAVEVYLNNELASSREVLDALSRAVAPLPVTRSCSDRPGA